MFSLCTYSKTYQFLLPITPRSQCFVPAFKTQAMAYAHPPPQKQNANHHRRHSLKPIFPGRFPVEAPFLTQSGFQWKSEKKETKKAKENFLKYLDVYYELYQIEFQQQISFQIKST